MTTVFVVAIVFGSILTLVALICGTVIAVARMRKSGLGKTTHGRETDETEIIQEIFHGLSRMEERIEALETILMDGKDSEGLKS